MDMAAIEPKYSGVDYKADERESEVSMAVSMAVSFYLPELAAIFLTIASTSLRSLSLRLDEYRRIWLRNRTSSSLSCGRPLDPLLFPDSEKNCESGSSIAPAILAS